MKRSARTAMRSLLLGSILGGAMAMPAQAQHIWDPVDVRPRVVHMPELPSPPLFWIITPSYWVVLDTLGRPDSARTRKDIAHRGEFADAFLVALRGFRYTPAIRGGRPVENGFHLKLRFDPYIDADTTPGEMRWSYEQFKDSDVVVGTWHSLPPPTPLAASEKRAMAAAVVTNVRARREIASLESTLTLVCWHSAEIPDHAAEAGLDAMQYCHTEMQRTARGAITVGIIRRLNENEAWVTVSVLRAEHEWEGGACKLTRRSAAWSAVCEFSSIGGYMSGRP